jgi:hypothetical protein
MHLNIVNKNYKKVFYDSLIGTVESKKENILIERDFTK